MLKRFKSFISIMMVLLFVVSYCSFNVNAAGSQNGPANVRQTAATAKGVVALSWDKVTGAAKYKVEWKVGTYSRTKTVTKTVANITGVNPGKEANVTVSAIDDKNTVISSSSCTALGVPKTTSQPVADSVIACNKRVQLKWDADKTATGYEVQISTLSDKKIKTYKVKKNKLDQKINGIATAGYKVKIRTYREIKNKIVRNGQTINKTVTLYGKWCGTRTFVPQCNVTSETLEIYPSETYYSFKGIANAVNYKVYVVDDVENREFTEIMTIPGNQHSFSSDEISDGDKVVVLPVVKVNGKTYSSNVLNKKFVNNFEYCQVK